MIYNPQKPAVLDGEMYHPMATNVGFQVRPRAARPANAGALAAINQALHDLANPPPPVTRWFKVRRWMRDKLRSAGVWYRWKGHQWRSFRLGMGHRVGSWIAGEDIR